jgi:dihydroorotate dehydrogenase (NAD+) catalytic subunit
MVDLRVNIGGLFLNNPVMPASGTFAEGLAPLIPFDELGALVTKTITAELREGNPVRRAAETAQGVIWNIGIPSKGIDYFIAVTLPFYQKFKSPLIVSVSAPTADGFAEIARRLSIPGVAGIEANISCPNLEENGHNFAMQPSSTGRVVSKLRQATKLPLWVKLTPNAGEIVAIAHTAEDAGADALVIANTILAMAVDVETFTPKLGGIMGGLSGPAVRPVILRMAYQCAKAVKIPIIGCGGVFTANDAIEYLLAGATAVQIGMATFVRPTAMIDIIQGLVGFCRRKGIARVRDLIGALKDGQPNMPEIEAAVS